MRDSVTRQGKVQTALLSLAVIVPGVTELHTEEGTTVPPFLIQTSAGDMSQVANGWDLIYQSISNTARSL